MTAIEYRSTTNSRRNMTSSDLAEITKKKPEKTLLGSQSHTAGRNSYGRITVKHRGGGHKQKYRIIDFKRNKDGVKAVVKVIEYDLNRTANITPLHCTNGIKAYILVPKDLRVGAAIESSPNADIKPGNALPLSVIPADTEIHSTELKPGKGSRLVRSTGTVVQAPGNDGKHTLVRLQSGEARKILPTRRATIGSVDNEQHSLAQLGRAGRKRWLDKRPQSCGSVVNPNGHLHSGGESRTPVGRPQPMTPRDKKFRGTKTRNSKARSGKFIIRHRKGNK